MQFFIKEFFVTMQAKFVIFGMQVDDELLYRGIIVGLGTSLLLFLPFVCLIFFLSSL